MLVTVTVLTAINEVIKVTTEVIVICLFCCIAYKIEEYEVSIISRATLVDKIKKITNILGRSQKPKETIEEAKTNGRITSLLSLAIAIDILIKFLQPILVQSEPYNVLQDSGTVWSYNTSELSFWCGQYTNYIGNVTSINDWTQDCLLTYNVFVSNLKPVQMSNLTISNYTSYMNNTVLLNNIKQYLGNSTEYTLNELNYNITGVISSNYLTDIASNSISIGIDSKNLYDASLNETEFNIQGISGIQQYYESISAPLYVGNTKSRSLSVMAVGSGKVYALRTYDAVTVTQLLGYDKVDLKDYAPGWQNDSAINEILSNSNSVLNCNKTCQINLQNSVSNVINIYYKSYGGMYIDGDDIYYSEASVMIQTDEIIVRYRKTKLSLVLYQIQGVDDIVYTNALKVYSESTNYYNSSTQKEYMSTFLSSRNDQLTLYYCYLFTYGQFGNQDQVVPLLFYKFTSGYEVENILLAIIIILPIAISLLVLTNVKIALRMYSRDLQTTLLATTEINKENCVFGEVTDRTIKMMTNMAGTHAYLTIDKEPVILDKTLEMRNITNTDFQKMKGISKMEIVINRIVIQRRRNSDIYKYKISRHYSVKGTKIYDMSRQDVKVFKDSIITHFQNMMLKHNKELVDIYVTNKRFVVGYRKKNKVTRKYVKHFRQTHIGIKNVKNHIRTQIMIE